MVMKIFLEGSWREISEIYSPDKAVLDVTAGTGSSNPGTHLMINDENISKLTFEVEEGGTLSEFFSRAPNLTRFDGSVHDFSEATSAYRMFYASNIVEVVNIMDLEKVTDMSGMFQDTRRLELVKNLKIYNNVSLISGGGNSIFRGSNPNLKLENVDVEDRTSLNSMFAYASKISLVEGEIINTHNITSMSGMFLYSDLEEFGMNALDTQNVTDMSKMFERTPLKYLDGNGLNTEKVINMRHMFYATSRLELVKNLKIYNDANLTQMFRTHSPNLKLENVDVEDCTSLNSMFAYGSKTSLVEGEVINTHNITNMSSMFLYSDLEEFGMNALDTQNVTDMSKMFERTPLKHFDTNGLNTEKVTNMENMFNNATKIEEIYLNMTNVNNIYNAFRRTNSLKSLILEGIGGALQARESNRTINVADTAMDGDALNAMAESLANTNIITPWIIEYDNAITWDTTIATNKGYIVRGV